jgi:hypothetical protein
MIGAGGDDVGLSHAERQRRYRERKKLLGQAAKGGSARPVARDARPGIEAATDPIEAVVEAGTAARSAAPAERAMWRAFEAGMAARMFLSVKDGIQCPACGTVVRVTGEEALRRWFTQEASSEAQARFMTWLTAEGYWSEFEAWLSSSSSPVDAFSVLR